MPTSAWDFSQRAAAEGPVRDSSEVFVLPRVNVIIPNFNGAKLLPTCLNSLRQQSFADFDVTVVDNGSADGSLALLAASFPDVRVIPLGNNHGFSAAVNVGIEATGGEFVAVVNSDVSPDPNWLVELVGRLQQANQVAAVAPKVLREPSGPKYALFDSAGDWYSIWGMAFPRGRDEPDIGQYDQGREVFGVSGAASLYRRTFFDDVGLFSERYFAYYEDVDLCLRGRMRGWTFHYEPAAVAHHKVAATSGGSANPTTRRLLSRNSIYVFVRCMPATLALLCLPTFALGQFLWLAHAFVTGRGSAHVAGLKEAVGSMPDLLRERRVIQSARTAPAANVARWLSRRFPPLERLRRRQESARRAGPNSTSTG